MPLIIFNIYSDDHIQFCCYIFVPSFIPLSDSVVSGICFTVGTKSGTVLFITLTDHITVSCNCEIILAWKSIKIYFLPLYPALSNSEEPTQWLPDSEKVDKEPEIMPRRQTEEAPIIDWKNPTFLRGWPCLAAPMFVYSALLLPNCGWWYSRVLEY